MQLLKLIKRSPPFLKNIHTCDSKEEKKYYAKLSLERLLTRVCLKHDPQTSENPLGRGGMVTQSHWIQQLYIYMYIRVRSHVSLRKCALSLHGRAHIML